MIKNSSVWIHHFTYLFLYPQSYCKAKASLTVKPFVKKTKQTFVYLYRLNSLILIK